MMAWVMSVVLARRVSMPIQRAEFEGVINFRLMNGPMDILHEMPLYYTAYFTPTAQEVQKIPSLYSVRTDSRCNTIRFA